MTDTRHRRGAVRTEAIMRTTLELGREVGYARLSIEAVAARAGAGKHTIYRRWPSKGALLLDSLLSLHEPDLDFSDTGDIYADLRDQMYAAVDLLAGPPFGDLVRALIGDAQHDPRLADAFNERFIAPQTAKTLARLTTARDQGRLSPDLDLDQAMAILSGPLYYHFLITREPLTRDRIDRMLRVLFTGLGPEPPASSSTHLSDSGRRRMS